MREINIFSSVRLDSDKICVIYSPDGNDFFLPVLLEGLDADLVEEWILDEGASVRQIPVNVAKSIISEVGANALYSEMKHDDELGGLIGRIVCRQQNEVNEIFSMINMPMSYVMVFGNKLFVDDQTVLVSALETADEVSELIGVNIKEEVGVNNGEED